MPHLDPEVRKAYHAEYQRKNAQSLKEKRHQYYLSNRQYFLDLKRTWEKNNREKKNATNRAWYLKNKDSVRPKRNAYQNRMRPRYADKARIYNASLSPDRLARKRQKTKEWHQRNPQFKRARDAHRRALKVAAKINLSGIQEWFKAVKSKKTFTCYYCCNSFDVKKVHFDHIVPLSRGGPHSVENLCTSCVTCNSSKHAKMPHEWKRHAQIFLTL